MDTPIYDSLSPDDDSVVEVDGHRVPAPLIDYYYDGETGRRITDDEWDTQRSRLREHGADPFVREG